MTINPIQHGAGVQVGGGDAGGDVDQMLHNLSKVWRRKWMTLFCGFLGLGIALLVSTYVRSYYTATATILVNPKNLSSVKDAGIDDLRNLQMQAAIIKSPVIVNDVIKKFNLQSIEPFNKVHSPAALFAKFLRVKANRGSRTIQISFSFYRPEMAALIANGLAEVFIYSGAARATGATKESVEALKKQVPKILERLERTREKMKEFRVRHPEVADYDILIRQVEQLNEELLALNSLSIILKTSLEDFDKYLESGGDAFTHPALRSRQEIAEKIKLLRDQEVILQEYLQEYREKHPRVIETQSEISALRRSLEIEKLRAISEMHNEQTTLEARSRTIGNSVIEIKKKLETMMPLVGEQQALIKAETAALDLIDSINAKVITSSLAADMKRPGVEILGRAEVPLKAANKKSKFLIVGFFMGLLGGAGLIFLKETLNRSLRTPTDVEEILHKPILGQIPFMKIAPKGFDLDLKDKRMEQLFQDAVSFIRTNINFVLTDTGNKIIMLTSAVPDEGKSFTTYHLAQSFAKQDRKVIIVDADFRRSFLKHIIPSPKEDAGLDKYLTSGMDLDSIIEKTDIQNLDFIRSGNAHFNTPEALSSQRMGDLLKELKNRYDVILLDTPPVIPVNDVLALEKWVETVVLVVCWGKTHRKIVNTAIQKMSVRNIPVLGVILTQVKGADRGQYYYYYYYHSHDQTPPKDKDKDKGLEEKGAKSSSKKDTKPPPKKDR